MSDDENALATPYDTGWRDRAQCSGSDSEVFFAEGRGGSNNYFRAKSICFRCPVQQECLNFAVDNAIYWGVWGGLTYRERLDYSKGKHPGTVTIWDVVKATREQHTIESLAEALGITVGQVSHYIRTTKVSVK